MSITGHVSAMMLRYYSHIRQEAKRKAVLSLDDERIKSQMGKLSASLDERRRLETAHGKRGKMVGLSGRF